MNKIKLYLDDIRTPLDNSWVVVRTYEDFVNIIEEKGLGAFSVISLDHDLGQGAMRHYFNHTAETNEIDYSKIDETTGYDCAKWLVDRAVTTGERLPDVYCHSHNPVGTSNILAYINSYFRLYDDERVAMASKIPFST